MGLWILRGIFVVVATAVTVAAMESQAFRSLLGPDPYLFYAAVVLAVIGLILGDVLLPNKRLDVISSVYFGILIGLFLTFTLGVVLQPLMIRADDTRAKDYLPIINMLLAVPLCYICISMLLQTKDDFRFIIPYVEFAKEIKGVRPYVLDTSVIIDGRIADLAETSILDSQLIMPRFVLAELQGIADSTEKLRRARGRRGLDVLSRLRSSPHVDFKIHDHEPPELSGQPVDMKLVLLAKNMGGKVVTGDYNLNKVARIHNVPVINLNDIANALKPVFLPGESIEVRVVKAGEEAGQGVGYLDDGTMIVIEGGREHIGRVIKIGVTNVLQNSAGRMIFGRYQPS